MRLYKKLLCACLGHKIPEATKGLPYTTLAGQPIGDKYYVWDTFICERCTMFHTYTVYTRDAWEAILTKRSNCYLDELEKLTSNIFKGLGIDTKVVSATQDIILEDENNETSPTSKLIH